MNTAFEISNKRWIFVIMDRFTIICYFNLIKDSLSCEIIWFDQ